MENRSNFYFVSIKIQGNLSNVYLLFNWISILNPSEPDRVTSYWLGLQINETGAFVWDKGGIIGVGEQGLPYSIPKGLYPFGKFDPNNGAGSCAMMLYSPNINYHFHLCDDNCGKINFVICRHLWSLKTVSEHWTMNIISRIDDTVVDINNNYGPMITLDNIGLLCVVFML